MLRDVPPEALELLGRTLATCAHSLEATRPRVPLQPYGGANPRRG